MSQPLDNLFAGVDGGGSKTLAVVVDATGRERGRGAAGSSNYTAVGLEEAISHIHEAVTQATDAAGGRLPLRAAWMGLAGVDRPGAQDLLLPRLRGLADQIRLSNDAELVLSSLEGAVGVAVIAGTGSIILGKNTSGRVVRAGGWGHLLGDEGSGYDLGRRGLQAAARAADGRGPATALVDAFLHLWNLDNPIDMIAPVYADDSKAAIAQLASHVFAAAAAGDKVARKLLAGGAAELALGAVVVGDALGFADGKLPLALSGGLLTGNTAYRAMVLRRIRYRWPVGQVTVVDDPALSAARGAVRLAEAGR